MAWSDKQKFLMRWWCNPRYSDCDGIICDGAIRSGKTVSMSCSFAIWAMAAFDGCSFAICGKTLTSVRRNVIHDLLSVLRSIGMGVKERISAGFFELTFNGRCNRFYLFGGKDEGSAALIQGLTLAGLLLDEAALMPRSFVEQAAARCSLTGAKLWFNCNPEGPYHWFKTEWIDKAEEKNLLHLRFEMKDNPSLSDSVRRRYERLYTGAFYRRFIKGEWTAAQGLVYPMFDRERHTFSGNVDCQRYAVSIDYGTVNPCSMGLWGLSGGVWYRLREYYHDSRLTGERRTDEEHYKGLCSLIGSTPIEVIVCDPSAQSFIQCIRRHSQYRVLPAVNDVVGGIRLVSDFIREGKLRICVDCADTLRELSQYRWDETALYDRPVKDHDHAMDDIRYFVATVAAQSEEQFFVMSVDRE